jgi:hypothetical protein
MPDDSFLLSLDELESFVPNSRPTSRWSKERMGRLNSLSFFLEFTIHNEDSHDERQLRSGH